MKCAGVLWQERGKKEALVRLFKALLRLYSGSIQALLRQTSAGRRGTRKRLY